VNSDEQQLLNMCCMQAAMRDKWLNTGYHGDELQPYTESSRDIDSERFGMTSLNVVSNGSVCFEKH